MRFQENGRMITKEIIERMDRENAMHRARHIFQKVTYEIARFAILLFGVSAFVFIEIPLMEAHAERALLICELLIAFFFALWFGNWIYGRKDK